MAETDCNAYEQPAGACRRADDTFHQRLAASMNRRRILDRLAGESG